MNRPIKFRAWLSDIQRIVNVIKIEQWGEETNIEVYIENEDTEGEEEYLNGEFELLQYTGLKDINGVEIYEGDIVIQNPMTSTLYPITGVVKFDEGAYWVDNGKDARILFSEIDTNEILGNTYENPDLLEVEKNV